MRGAPLAKTVKILIKKFPPCLPDCLPPASVAVGNLQPTGALVRKGLSRLTRPKFHKNLHFNFNFCERQLCFQSSFNLIKIVLFFYTSTQYISNQIRTSGDIRMAEEEEDLDPRQFLHGYGEDGNPMPRPNRQPRPLNYAFVEGKKAGTYCVLSEGKLYMLDQEKCGKSYYRCHRRAKYCFATGYIADTDRSRFVVNHRYPHR